MFGVILLFIKGLHFSLSKNNVYKVLATVLVIMLLCTTAFYLCERGNIEGLTYWDAMWWSFVTVTTVGYGDYFPISFIGRIMAALLMVSGIGAFGFATAAVASAFVETNLKKGMGLLKLDLNNHIIIVGWNKRTSNIVEELTVEVPDKAIVIIDDIERLETDYKNLYFIKGKGTEDSVLEKASTKKASLAIVLADEKSRDSESADAQSVMVCLAINHINPDLHLVAEVLNEEHVPHFRRAKVDEVFVSSKIGSKLLIRGALYPKVSHAINELLTNCTGSELYEAKLSETYFGMKFAQVIDKLTREGIGIPIGVANADGTFVNPEMNYVVRKGDILIYIGKEPRRSL